MNEMRLLQATGKRLAGFCEAITLHMDRPWAGPRQVIADITDRCFFRCVTCDRWKSQSAPGEMSTAEWFGILQRLFDWLGPYHLSISGGEPLCRDDICEIVAFARDHALTTNLMTNGWLVDAKMARSLVDAGLGNLTFSLNAFRPATHDRTRGVPGSHAHVVAGIGHAQEARANTDADMTVSISALVAAATVDEMPDLVHWAWQIGVDAVGLQPLVDVSLYKSYGGRSKRSRPSPTPGLETEDTLSTRTGVSGLWASDQEQTAQAIEELIALKMRGAPILNSVRQLRLIGAHLHEHTGAPATSCSVGHDSLLIDPYGNARLCYRMEPIGDIRAVPPAVLWSSSVAKRTRAWIRSCRLGCALLNCNYRRPLAERVVGLLRRVTALQARTS